MPAARALAQIMPLSPTEYDCSECPARVTALNEMIPGWASSTTSAASPVLVVDQWSGFDVAADTVDGVHPNRAGAQKMADRWYPALTR